MLTQKTAKTIIVQKLLASWRCILMIFNNAAYFDFIPPTSKHNPIQKIQQQQSETSAWILSGQYKKILCQQLRFYFFF